MSNKEYAAFQGELFVARSKLSKAEHLQQLRVVRNDAMARARAEKARVDAGCLPPLTGGTSNERIDNNARLARATNWLIVQRGKQP